jgi:hypothetical protein
LCPQRTLTVLAPEAAIGGDSTFQTLSKHIKPRTLAGLLYLKILCRAKKLLILSAYYAIII